MITSTIKNGVKTPISAEFKAKINNGETPFVRMQFIPVVGNSFFIEDGDFWMGSISFSEAVSNEGAFEVGGAVIGGFNFSLNNFDRKFDTVDFAGAVVVPLIYYTINGVKEYIPKGIFYINSHRTSGNIIVCTAMDALKLLDKSQTTIEYPITVQDLIETICTANNITLATETITNGSFQLTTAPSNSDTPLTDRQVLSYACQITGNYAKMNEEGELVVGWFDFSEPYFVKSTFNGKSLWTKPIEVTGIRVGIGGATGALMAVSIDGNGNLQYMRMSEEVDTFYINGYGELIAVTSSGATYTIVDGSLMRTGEELVRPSENEDINVLYGSDENVIRIDGNPFITISNVATICQMISERIFGQAFRPGTIPILSNPCLRAGDVLRIRDNTAGFEYIFPITSLTYNKSVTETINCAFEDKEDNDLRLSSDYSTKVSVAEAMKRALEADAIARAAEEAAAVSGYQYLILSDKGTVLTEDGYVNLTAIIFDSDMIEIDPEGTDYLYRWWVMQDSNSAAYLDGGKEISIYVDDALCDYAAGIYFETLAIDEGINPFSLSQRSDTVVLTTRAGLPLTSRAAESVVTE